MTAVAYTFEGLRHVRFVDTAAEVAARMNPARLQELCLRPTTFYHVEGSTFVFTASGAVATVRRHDDGSLTVEALIELDR